MLISCDDYKQRGCGEVRRGICGARRRLSTARRRLSKGRRPCSRKLSLCSYYVRRLRECARRFNERARLLSNYAKRLSLLYMWRSGSAPPDLPKREGIWDRTDATWGCTKRRKGKGVGFYDWRWTKCDLGLTILTDAMWGCTQRRGEVEKSEAQVTNLR